MGKKRKTTGVKAGGGLGEKKTFLTLKGDGHEKQSKSEMFDSAALGVNIIYYSTL